MVQIVRTSPRKKSFISKRGCLISHLSNILKLRNDDDDSSVINQILKAF
jgi:hypothetical protein